MVVFITDLCTCCTLKYLHTYILTIFFYQYVSFFFLDIAKYITGRVLVLHSRLVAPLGPGDGIPFPYSCYIYDCSYLRGPPGYSMCFENLQHPPSEKPMLLLDRTWLPHQRVGSPPITRACQCDRLTFWNVCQSVSECLVCLLYCCLNACRCVCLAVCFRLCLGLRLRVVVCAPWSDLTCVWQPMSCTHAA